MLSDADLQLAVQRGIITEAQRSALAGIVKPPPAEREEDIFAEGSDENIRLIGGGNDLFVTIGVVLLSAGLYFALSSVFGGTGWLIAAVLTGFFWLVAEFVTRQRRMRLSSTVLGLFFAGSVANLLWAFIDGRYNFAAFDTPAKLAGLRPIIGSAGWIGIGGIVVAAAIYFWRFRVPIMAGVIAVSLTALAFMMTALTLYDGVIEGAVTLPTLADLPEILRNALYVPLICGLVVFVTGVTLDLHDRERVTIWSDCAFWLHVVSAPLLVHPLFIMATGQDVAFGRIEPGAGATIMLTILILTFVYVALAIDRRSLLIPTLAYFGTLGIYYLVNSAANTTGVPPFALILLVIGALIMVFGAGWQRIRNLIVRPTLPTSVLDKLPPIKIQTRV